MAPRPSRNLREDAMLLGDIKDDVAMDPTLWGNLKDYVAMEIIYAKVPFHKFFQLRLVCKEWNHLAGDRKFLEDHFREYLVPEPYFYFPGGCESLVPQPYFYFKDGRYMNGFLTIDVTFEDVGWYRIAQMYMVTKIQEQQTAGGEGVEVLINRPFEDEEFGQGQYTSKIYHLQSKIPTWLSTFVPTKFMYIEEEAWNAYPKCKTVLKCPYLNRFKLTIETIHVADNGNSPNVHNLNKEALAARKVENLDIGSNLKDYWSYVVGGPEIDLTKFKSEKTGRGPLTPGWQASCNPVMTAYKLVTVDVPYWGFGYRLEQALLGAERSLFTESNKRCFHWIDEWFGLTYEDVRRMEVENDRSLNQKLGKTSMESVATENVSSSSEPVKKDASLPSSVSVRS